jgi:hypothetical protein
MPGTVRSPDCGKVLRQSFQLMLDHTGSCLRALGSLWRRTEGPRAARRGWGWRDARGRQRGRAARAGHLAGSRRPSRAAGLGRLITPGATCCATSGRRALGEESCHLAARETPALTDAAWLPRDGNFENALGQIHGDGRMLFHGLLLSVVVQMTPYDIGTTMPLMSREESISSFQRTRALAFARVRSPLNAHPLGSCERGLVRRLL